MSELILRCAPAEMNVRTEAMRVLGREVSELDLPVEEREAEMERVAGLAFSMPIEEAVAIAAQRPRAAVELARAPLTALEQDYLDGKVKLAGTPIRFARRLRIGRPRQRAFRPSGRRRLAAAASHGPPGRPARPDDDPEPPLARLRRAVRALLGGAR